ncbi:MAG: CDP-alcohol phosphatidyltransferase family protein [Clostridia bacterium]|nr:CDP-alcohol phosphatidyltransferase family protein [Clostridia bacterium]
MIGFYNYTVIVTYMGTVSALMGMFAALTHSPTAAVLFFCVCGFCDMFDGAIARTRKRTDEEKRFGIQIDSLSDLVAFGVFPAVIGYSIGLDSLWHMPLLAGYMLAALIRLAYFNVMEENRQKTETGKRKEYDGLPVTTSSLFFPLVYLVTMRVAPHAIAAVYGVTMAVVGTLFISPIKVKKLSVKGNLAVAAVGMAIVAVVYMVMGR